MGYPDNVLAADERVVLHRHPHWKRLVGPVLVLLLVTAVAAFGLGVVNHTDWEQTAKNVVMIVIAVIWLVIVGWLTLWPFLNWRDNALRHHRSPGDVPPRRADARRASTFRWRGSTASSSGTGCSTGWCAPAR